jgi:hypothetical protein
LRVGPHGRAARQRLDEHGHDDGCRRLRLDDDERLDDERLDDEHVEHDLDEHDDVR